ncbi:MAG: acyltransferase [Tannerella sp.]|jgi:fucose 4-O-acetylase-like acetyltransferase|nr:acyltransferase [Tannerella sp.]
MMSKRFVSVDVARAVCILLVVTGHYEPADCPSWYGVMNRVIYGFHMPLFMFVSGYVYWATRQPARYADFVRKKFNRLMIPYFLVSVLIISIKLITESGRGLHVENPVSRTAFFEMCYLPSAGYFLWFVYALFLIFLTMPFFRPGNRLYLLFVASLVWLLIPVRVTEWFCMAEYKNHLFYFVAGCMAGREEWIRRTAGKIRPAAAMAVCAGIYVLTFELSAHHPEGIARATLRMCTALAGITFILYLSRMVAAKGGVVRRFLIWLSAASYTIYLFHTTFEGFAKAMLSYMKTASNTGFPFLIGAAFVILTGIAGPVVLYQLSVKLKERIKRTGESRRIAKSED